MKIEELKNLAGLMRDYELTRLEIGPEGGIVIERKPAEVTAPATEKPVAAAPAQREKKEETVPEGRTIKAPMVGVFYAAASPEANPFVKTGDTVKKGDVIMIIESMKLMNEVQSEFNGVVEKILVSNGQAVEFDQPIMIIK